MVNIVLTISKVVPRVGEMAGDISDPEEEEDASLELDRAVPRHELLDNTAAKHKTELVHRGGWSRNKPTQDKLRTQILKRSQSDMSTTSSTASPS